MRGVIKFYDLNKHFGFISVQDVPDDIFFCKENLLDDEKMIKTGNTVEFVLVEKGGGSFRATDVLLIHPPSYWEKLKI